MCEAPRTAQSIATLVVLCCSDGCVGLVSDSGMRDFCFLILCLCVSCCVCALISLPLALVVCTYLCSVVFLVVPGAGRDRLRNGVVYGVLFVNLVAYALVG